MDTSKLRCPLCLEEVQNLESPKQLPCTHIICVPCLQGISITTEAGVEASCCVCQKKHIVKDLAHLVEPSFDEQSNGTAAKKPKLEECVTVKCDKCPKSAECHCVNCSKSLCSVHEEFHRGYFADDLDDEESHKVISIAIYQQRRGLYAKLRCVQHNKGYVYWCKVCDKMRCKGCKSDDKCEGDKDHVFSTVEDAHGATAAVFDEHLKQCSAKVTELCRAEKRTWHALDEVEVTCTELVSQVKEKTAKLMGSLQENSDKLIERIEGHLVSCKDQVERDLLEARTSREVLDDRRMHCIQFQQENHITRVIREKPNLLCRDLLTQNCDNITNPPSAEHWQNVVKKYMQVSISPSIPPCTLERTVTLELDHVCESLSFTGDGKHLLVASPDHLMVYRLNAETGCWDSKRIVLHTASRIIAVKSSETQTYLLQKHPKSHAESLKAVANGEGPGLHLPIAAATQPQQLPTLMVDVHCDQLCAARSIAFSDCYLAVDFGQQTVSIFERATRREHKQYLEYGVRDIFIFDEKFLVVAGDKRLTKYEIEEVHHAKNQAHDLQLRRVWNSENISRDQKVVKMSQMEDGHILVTTRPDTGEGNGCEIVIFSDQGRVVSTLKDQSVGGCNLMSTNLDVCGDQVAFNLSDRQIQFCRLL